MIIVSAKNVCNFSIEIDYWEYNTDEIEKLTTSSIKIIDMFDWNSFVKVNPNSLL